MCATIIAVLSYAFQLAGALLLLLWCIGKCDANVVKGCFDNHASSYVGGFDEGGPFTMIPEEDLQQSAQNVYRNIATFANLAIGYALTIFMTDICISPWCVLIYVAIVVVLILAVEHFSINLIASKKYSSDRKRYDNEHKPKKGDLKLEAADSSPKDKP